MTPIQQEHQPSPLIQPSSNERGWGILRLDGPRPPEWGIDTASVSSPHCTRLAALSVMDALSTRYGTGMEIDGPWVIDAREAWSRLGYGDDLASLDARYTRWLTPTLALRSQTSALIPRLSTS